jgi:hypothetical protein
VISFAVVVGLAAVACAARGPGAGSITPGSIGSSPTAGSSAAASPTVDPSGLRVDTAGWRTDFAKHSVDLRELLGGGPPKDGIPAIDRPHFESIADARAWLTDRAPVISITVGDQARAYPIAILVWHEIVNDTLAGRPITVTFCPLCNTALVFDRTVGPTVYDFGTTGNLRLSDLVMYDRQTESWWQQATGEAIVGTLTGTRLTFMPAQMISLGAFAAAYPTGDVLSRDTGTSRPYGQNPYASYDQADTQPFLFSGTTDGRLPPKERVVSVGQGGNSLAFPYTALAKIGVVETSVGGEPVVVFWVAGTASPLDTQDILGHDVGATGRKTPVAAGRPLTFHRDGGANAPIVDSETGSTWSVTGLATAGPLKGTQLDPVVHGDHFWFAWAAFAPGTRIWMGP